VAPTYKGTKVFVNEMLKFVSSPQKIHHDQEPGVPDVPQVPDVPINKTLTPPNLINDIHFTSVYVEPNNYFMNQSQVFFNEEIIKGQVDKKMWKSFTDKEYKFVLSLMKQRYPFTERQNKWFTDIINKYKVCQ
jgi:hypothetical protein